MQVYGYIPFYYHVVMFVQKEKTKMFGDIYQELFYLYLKIEMTKANECCDV